MWCFGTDQILVRQRYELRGSCLENDGYIVYLTTHLLLVVKNNLPLHLFWSKMQYYYIMSISE